LLWPRIERGLRQQARSRWVTLLQVAAVLLLIAGMAAAAWRVQRRSEFDNHILRAGAVEEVERAQQAHMAAIEKLERVAGPTLENSASPLLVNYKEKLMLLDDAIAECQSNIDHNRKNAQLRRQLLAIYGEKQQTLQNVLREETHATP
jgi:flagellar basal body-associated protein FliL